MRRERLLLVTRAVTEQLARRPVPALDDLMGSAIDAVKLVSSMTLFREWRAVCIRSTHSRNWWNSVPGRRLSSVAGGAGWPAVCGHPPATRVLN